MKGILTAIVAFVMLALTYAQSPSGQAARQTNTSAALVRVANLVPNGSKVDILIDGKVAFKAISSEAISGYLLFPAGKHRVSVVKASQGAQSGKQSGGVQRKQSGGGASGGAAARGGASGGVSGGASGGGVASGGAAAGAASGGAASGGVSGGAASGGASGGAQSGGARQGQSSTLASSRLEFKAGSYYTLAVTPTLASLQAQLDITLQPAKARVSVTGPNGYEQSFRGSKTLQALRPGGYTIAGTSEGYHSAQKTVTLKAGDRVSSTLTLQPIAVRRQGGAASGAQSGGAQSGGAQSGGATPKSQPLQIQLRAFTDQPRFPPAGQALIRIVQVSPDVPAIKFVALRQAETQPSAQSSGAMPAGAAPGRASGGAAVSGGSGGASGGAASGGVSGGASGGVSGGASGGASGGVSGGAASGAASGGAASGSQAAAAGFDWQQLGASTYNNCAACHQANGQGIPGTFPPLAGHLPDIYNTKGGRTYLIHAVLFGLQGQISVKGQSYNGVMPSWTQLSDEQVAAVLDHELTSWGNDKQVKNFKPIQPSEVKAERSKNLTPQQVYQARQKLGLGGGASGSSGSAAGGASGGAASGGNAVAMSGVAQSGGVMQSGQQSGGQSSGGAMRSAGVSGGAPSSKAGQGQAGERSGGVAPSAAAPQSQPQTLLTNLAFGQASDYITIPEGTYQFQIRTNDSNRVLLELSHSSLKSGVIYTFYLFGSAGKGTLSLTTSVDALVAQGKR